MKTKNTSSSPAALPHLQPLHPRAAQSWSPSNLGMLAQPGVMHSQAALQPLSGGQSCPSASPLPYAPVSVGGRHCPDLDAFQGAFASHYHTLVGVLVGVVALGLRGAMRPAGPARGEQPVNCGTRGEAVTGLAWATFLHSVPGLSRQLCTPQVSTKHQQPVLRICSTPHEGSCRWSAPWTQPSESYSP